MIGLVGATGNIQELPESLISGGKLGGLLSFRSEALDASFNQLGLMATSFTQTFNAQHALGRDLLGNANGSASFVSQFFSVGAPDVIPYSKNATGSPTVSITLDPVTTNGTNYYSNLTASDYRLSYESGALTLTRLSDNTSWSGASVGAINTQLAGNSQGFTLSAGAGLEERDQNRSEARPISIERLRLGARLIAAAATLAQESAIRVPDGADNARGIPVREVLTDWDDVDCATLLSRPIFDEGSYGTVRFHHRSVREYLTAEWLHALIVDEGSRARIENLFFRSQYGIDVVVPTMRPVLPWLAVHDERILARVCRLAPEVIFEGGDPSQLQRETRSISPLSHCGRRRKKPVCATCTSNREFSSWTHTEFPRGQTFPSTRTMTCGMSFAHAAVKHHRATRNRWRWLGLKLTPAR